MTDFPIRVMAIGMLVVMGAMARGADLPFANLAAASTNSGYLARLLVNETPFPGERGWVSVEDSEGCMVQILWVLHGRIKLIPAGYRQGEVAGVVSQDMIDVITGTGGRRQCEGFYRDGNGRAVTAARVGERINNLLSIANRGGKPGRFAGLIEFAQGLSDAYFADGIDAADRFAKLRNVGRTQVTGRAYAWMTDANAYHPGGRFVAIPDDDGGSIGGNRFFTLKKMK